jgi:glycosyltransferase 2 family protein
MTAERVSPDEPTRTRGHSWNVALLSPTEPGRRNRRPADAVFLVAGAIVAGLTAVVASSAPGTDANIAQALMTVLGWAGALWRTVFVGLLVLALIIVLDTVVRRRWDLTRDVLVALLVLMGTGVVLSGIVASDWLPVEGHVLSRWGFPELRLATATAIIVVVGPELVRTVRLVATLWIPVAAVSAVVVGAALPSEVLGAMALGVFAGALVRLVFGSAAGVPPVALVRSELAALGVQVNDLVPAREQSVGSASYVARDADNHSLKVRVLGRDAQDTQRLARQWRSLSYRDPPRSAPVGRVEQVEHEALATLVAARAGVRVPEVVIAALGPEGNALIVTRQPNVEPLERSSPHWVSDDTLLELWRQVDRLHTAGISHGRLNLGNVLLTEDGPMIVDWAAATLGAPQSALDIDVAELTVASTVLVGPDRAWRLAVDAGWADAVGRVLPYLQRAALTPHLRDLARKSEVGLKDLRLQVAETTGQDVPEVVPLHRFRLKDVALTAALAFAAYLIISQLADIGFRTIAHELRQMDVAWFLLALILAQATFVASGISFRGAVPSPLALLPCVVLQSAIKFINLTVPSSAGRIGINIRFLQQMGAPTPQAVAAGAVDDISETLVQIALVLITLPFVHITLQTGDLNGPSSRLVTTVLILLALVVVAVAAVPALRAKMLPPIKNAASSLWAVISDRRKRLELFGGNVASETIYALALGATCLAYGVHLSLAELILANTAASVFSSLIPVPGGVGAAEASMTAVLVALGVDNSTAFTIAFTQRLCTYYLPPIWGYASLRWLNRKGYL